MADVPNYPYTVEDADTIRDRMLEQVSDEWDKTEGGFIHDAVAPAAIEVARGQVEAQEILKRGFVAWNSGSYLEAKCAERGVYRRPAAPSKGYIRVTGTTNTVIYGGTKFSTQVDVSSGNDPVEFTTDQWAQIPSSGVVDIPATCVTAGIVGNVQANTIVVNMSKVAGVTAVTNPAAFTGGADAESDDALRSRFLEAAKVGSSSGNISDYKNWASEASVSVGRAKVRPLWDGNGTAQVLIVDTAINPASPDLVKAVQTYIDPPYSATAEDTDFIVGGAGVSIDLTQADSSNGSTAKMVYDAAAQGTIQKDVLSLLQANTAYSKAGIYRVWVRAKVDSVAGSTDLLQVQVTNVATGSPAVTRSGGGTQSVSVVKASNLSTSFGYIVVEFYWDGSADLRLDITRLSTDTATVVWVDNAQVYSLFGEQKGGGKAPIGAKVSVMPPATTTVDVQVGLTISAGYDTTGVKTKVQEAIDAYIKSLALTDNPNVLIGRISNAIFSVDGVEDYTNLAIRADGGAWQTTNITIADDVMAVFGAMTWM